MPGDVVAAAPTIREEIKQSKPFRTKSHEAYVSLLRTADESRRFVSAVVEAEGLTLQQYNVLRILRGAGPEGLPTLTVGERMLERTPGVTRLIDRMERKGWVRRERCTEDRRRVWCMITESGLTLLACLDPRIAEVDDALAGTLDEHELETFSGYLDRIRAHLRELSEAR